jgi:hypothetical protein
MASRSYDLSDSDYSSDQESVFPSSSHGLIDDFVEPIVDSDDIESDGDTFYADLEQLRLEFDNWDEIPSKISSILAANADAPLHGPHGLLVYQFASQAKRDALIKQVFDEIMEKIGNARDFSTIAELLHHYLAAKVRLYVRFPKDIHSRDWYVAQEDTQTHAIVTPQEAKGLLCRHLFELLEKIDEHLFLNGDVSSTHKRVDLIKELLKDQDCEDADDLKSELRYHQKGLGFRAVISGVSGKAAIIAAYMQRCDGELYAGQAPVIQGNTEWLPCPELDVHLVTGCTRKRWLCYNISGTTKANFTVPADLVAKPVNQWTSTERQTHFGPMTRFLSQLSGQNNTLVRRMLISLYMQLLGHNHDKYLHLWTGDGNNGKSLLLNLLCRTMGDLAQPLSKDVLFNSGKSKAAHSGVNLQLIDIRSGVIDEVSRRDTLNEQAVKHYVSADVTVAMRAPGERKKQAVKSLYRISCALLVAYNRKSFPKFRQEIALMNRLRFVIFPVQFVHRELTQEEKDSGLFSRANTRLSEILKQTRVQEQFLNMIIMYGGLYYRENKDQYGEPLPPTDDKIEDGPPSQSSGSQSPASRIKTWFLRRTKAQPGAQIPVCELATLYCEETGQQLENPVQHFGQYLKSAFPGIRKSQRVVEIDNIKATRMVIHDYVLVPLEEK